MPLLATAWEIQPPDKFVVKLREGVKWQDGKDFTAQDVITTFETGRLMNWVVWRFVSEIEALDEHTLVFKMETPSTVVVRYVLRERIRSRLGLRRLRPPGARAGRPGRQHRLR